MFIYEEMVHRRIQRRHLLLLTLESMVVKGECMEIESGPTIISKNQGGREYVPWWLRILWGDLGHSRPYIGRGVGGGPSQGGGRGVYLLPSG
jgi:hypothetical protein